MSAQADSGPVISSKTRNYTLAMLVAIYASSHVDRQIVSILAESIKLELMLSDTQLGFLIGLSFAIFYATLGIPIAILADRYSRRNIIAISVIVWSGMTALCGLAGSYLQLALARIAVGQNGDGNAQSGIKNGKAEADEKTQLGVRQHQLQFNALGQNRHDLPVDMAGLMTGMAGALRFLLSACPVLFSAFSCSSPLKNRPARKRPNPCRKTFSPKYGTRSKS